MGRNALPDPRSGQAGDRERLTRSARPMRTTRQPGPGPAPHPHARQRRITQARAELRRRGASMCTCSRSAKATDVPSRIVPATFTSHGGHQQDGQDEGQRQCHENQQLPLEGPRLLSDRRMSHGSNPLAYSPPGADAGGIAGCVAARPRWSGGRSTKPGSAGLLTQPRPPHPSSPNSSASL